MHQASTFGNRSRQRRFSRRTALGAAGGASTALLAAACSGSNNNGSTAGKGPASTNTVSAGAAGPAGSGTVAAAAATPRAAASPAAAAPKRGGELHLAENPASFGTTMDPHTSVSGAFWYLPLYGDRLVEPDHATFEPIHGALVEKWEQVDPTTFTLTVRPGVTWHEGKMTNGRPFIAKDAAFNLMRIAGKLDPDRKAQFQRASLLIGMDKAEAVDDKTVKVSFTQPNATFLAGLADFRQFMTAPEQVEKDPTFQNIKEIPGTGPFILQTWDDLTRSATYVANRKYWRPGEPYLDSVKQLAVTDQTSELAAFTSGQLHITNTLISQDNRATILRARPDAKIVKWQYMNWQYIWLNPTRPAFKDARIRNAIQLAIDYKTLLTLLYGDGFYNYTGPLPSGFPGAWTSEEVSKKPGWNPDTKQQDIADAKKLLEAAGFPNGKGVSFVYYGLSPSATTAPSIIIKDQLEKAFPEIKIMLQPQVDNTEFTRKLTTGDFDALDYAGAPAPGAIPEGNLYYHTGASRNYVKYGNPEVDALIDKGYVEFDTNARNQLVGQIEQKLFDDIYIVPYCKSQAVYGADPKIGGFDGFNKVGVQGIYDHAFAAHQMWLA